MASATEWRVERAGKVPDALKAKTRLRAPYRVLRGTFGNDGDFTKGIDDTARVTTAWRLKKTGGTTVVHVYDKQSDDDRKFQLDNFRARQSYDWHVAAKDDAALKDFCSWLAKETIKRVEAEPQPKRLTAASKEKVNELVAQGKSVADAMKVAAEWEIILPAAEAYKWPIPMEGKDR
jgi:hypothetical protein